MLHDKKWAQILFPHFRNLSLLSFTLMHMPAARFVDRMAQVQITEIQTSNDYL
jgi:hypothetical protein